MDLSFFPLTLEAIDQAAAESLCLFIASDERPLTGLAGLADWRLSGRLSRLLRAGLLSGEAGEAVLTPPGPRLGFQKLFLFGVGRSDESEESLVEHLGEALRKLAQAGVREAAMQLPARLAPEVGIRTLIDELQGPGRAMVFGPDPQKLVSALSQTASLRSQPPTVTRPTVKVPTSPGMAPVRLPPAPAKAAPAAPEKVAKAPPPPAAPVRAEKLPEPPPPAPRAEKLAEAPIAEKPLDIPKAAPLPAAPSPPPPVAPVAEPTPAPAVATSSEPPIAPVAEPTPAPPAAAKIPPTEPASVQPPRPAPPPPQRYVPPPPKPHVFEKGKRRKKR